MKKITITQYRKESSAVGIGAYMYHYGVNFNGNHTYSVTTTEEGMMYMMKAFKESHEVEFVEGWKGEPQM